MLPYHLRKSHWPSEANSYWEKKPPKYIIRDSIPAKALCHPQMASRLISQAAVLISVV